ncbi:MAG: plastocyanin domain-containing protein [Cryomorphaceae bacterium]|jgi:plastocyanin domain-containing protein
MIIVNLMGLLAIAMVVWWFWFYKPTSISASEGRIVITVDAGSYSPAHIAIPAHKPTTLTFLRKDASPCAELVMIPSIDINETLPLNQAISVDLPALEPGEYPFHCQMEMYRGMLKVS